MIQRLSLPTEYYICKCQKQPSETFILSYVMDKAFTFLFFTLHYSGYHSLRGSLALQILLMRERKLSMLLITLEMPRFESDSLCIFISIFTLFYMISLYKVLLLRNCHLMEWFRQISFKLCDLNKMQIEPTL